MFTAIGPPTISPDSAVWIPSAAAIATTTTAVGVLGAQFNLSTTVPRLVMFVAAPFVHEVMFAGLHALIGGRPVALHYSTTLVQALVNGLVGVTVFLIVERGPDAVQRRRMSRGTFGRKRY